MKDIFVARWVALLVFAFYGFAGSPEAGEVTCPDPPLCMGPDSPRAAVVIGSVQMPPLAPTSGPPRLSPYSRQRYRAPQHHAPATSVEDVVIYASTAPAGGGAGPHGAATIDQRDLTISPHVTAIQVGESVEFPNGDDVYHNLFSLSETKRFNLGRYAPGEARSVTFDKAGLVRLFCDIHSDMAAVILVLDHGYFTRPRADGTYRLEGLPPGRHTIVAWHEALPPDSVVVTVPDAGTVQADFSFGG